MIIQHNIAAINSYRNNKKNQSALGKNLEKLSSGYKITRAGDDAAGLAISEGLRALIRGTSQAESNILDGIGLIHTAEGAMQEIHAMFQRCYQLSLASSNDTYNDMDRQCMQEEVEQLLTEVDRVATYTEFNGIPVLQGWRVPKAGGVGGAGGSSNTIHLPDWVTNPDGSIGAGRMNGTYITEESYGGKKYDIRHASTTLDFSAINIPGTDIDELIGSGFRFTCFTCPEYYNFEFVKDGEGSRKLSGNTWLIDVTGITTAEQLTEEFIKSTQNGNPNHHFTKLKADGGKLIIYDDRCIDNPPAGTSSNGWGDWDFPDFNVNYQTNPRGGRFSEGVSHPLPSTTPPHRQYATAYC